MSSKLKFKGKEKFALWMCYWQKGLNLTSQAKYIIASIAGADILVTKDWKFAAGLFTAYFVMTFIVGAIWTHKMMTAEIEVGNKFNKFVNEMRKKIK